MADKKFAPIIINLLLVGLVVFSLIAGIALYAEQNDATTILSDPTLNNTENLLESNLSSYYSTVSQDEAAFSNSTINTNTNNIYVDAIGGIWKTMRVVPVAVYDLTLGFLFREFLSDNQKAIVISIISAILLISIIFAVWRLLATGDGG